MRARPAAAWVRVALRLMSAGEMRDFESAGGLAGRGLVRGDVEAVVGLWPLLGVERMEEICTSPVPMPWVTSIVGSGLEWMEPGDADEVRDLALRVLAENCGRSAMPEMVRRVEVPGIAEVLLKEPLLTSDNLGLKTWGSSLHLARRVVRENRALPQPVLELGAGTGLVGIAASRLGLDPVMTDLPDIVPNLAHNVELNGGGATVAALDWANHNGFASAHPEHALGFATVLVADPVYSDQHPRMLVETIARFARHGAVVYLQVPLRGRYEAERGDLWQRMEAGGHLVREEHEEGRDDWGEQRFVFREYRWHGSE